MCLSVPGRVTQIWQVGQTPMGHVDFGGAVQQVCLAYVPEVRVGQYVLVHVGFALSVLDEESARETLALFEELSREAPA